MCIPSRFSVHDTPMNNIVGITTTIIVVFFHWYCHQMLSRRHTQFKFLYMSPHNGYVDLYHLKLPEHSLSLSSSQFVLCVVSMLFSMTYIYLAQSMVLLHIYHDSFLVVFLATTFSLNTLVIACSFFILIMLFCLFCLLIGDKCEPSRVGI